jgi:hypothetical protein
MGLTIHYELRLAGGTTEEVALQMLERLRAHADTLGVRVVTPVFQFTGAELDGDDMEHGSVEWLLHLHSSGVRRGRDGTAEEIAEPSRLAAAGFVMSIGEGSEPGSFGLVRPLLTQRPTNVERTDEWLDWLWLCFCKTQYASAVSDEHFLECHLRVINMLDEAKRIGFGVTVHDEGLYWETRSTQRLLSELQKMNRIVAHFAGALYDAISPERSVEAAIFEHPDFERLETEPLIHDEEDDLPGPAPQ